LDFDDTKKKFLAAKKYKVLLFDYDGTLTKTHKLPEFAQPSKQLLEVCSIILLDPVLKKKKEGRKESLVDRIDHILDFEKSQ